MVTLTMGGQPREIRFTFDAVLAAEAAIGGISLRGLVLQNRGLTIDQTIRILWAVWAQEKPSLKFSTVRTWVKDYLQKDGGSLVAAETAILDAVLETNLIIPREASAEDEPADPPTGPIRDALAS